MRDIKLRAWYKLQNKMSAKDFNDFGYLDGVNPKTMFEDDTVEWMFWTGLLDKNGVEIYEGDIVSYMTGSVQIEPVEFANGGFYPFAIAGWEFVPKPNECEVIGNIYSNPELLTPHNDSKEQ